MLDKALVFFNSRLDLGTVQNIFAAKIIGTVTVVPVATVADATLLGAQIPRLSLTV